MVSREYEDRSEEDSAEERSERHCFVCFLFLPKQRRGNLGRCVFFFFFYFFLFLGRKKKKERKKRFQIKSERIRVIESTCSI